jgi:hypothetical protein
MQKAAATAAPSQLAADRRLITGGRVIPIGHRRIDRPDRIASQKYLRGLPRLCLSQYWKHDLKNGSDIFFAFYREASFVNLGYPLRHGQAQARPLHLTARRIGAVKSFEDMRQISC